MLKWTSLLAIATLMIFAGCDQEQPLTPQEQMALDLQLIEDYVAENNLDGFYTDNNIFVAIEEEGSSTETPGPTSVVEVVYTGKFLDGEVFDSSEGLAIEFALNRVIPGWQEGMQYFTPGSVGTLVIPSRHAYGPRGRSSIPPNSVLVFELELLDFR